MIAIYRALLLVITIHAVADLVRQAAERIGFIVTILPDKLLTLASEPKIILKWHVIIEQYILMANIIFIKSTMLFYLFITINFSCYISNL